MEENTIVIKQEGFDGDNSSLVLEEMDTVYTKEEVQDVLPSDAELLEVSCIPHVKHIKITFHALQQN